MPSEEIYASPSDVRTSLNMTSTDDDAMLTRILSVMSRLVDGYMGRINTGFQAIQTATAREYSGQGERYLYIDECIQITSVKVKDSLTDTTYDKMLSGTEYKAFRGSYSRPNYNDKPYHAIMLTANSTIGAFYSANSRSYIDWDDKPRKAVLEPTVEITARWGYADIVPDIIKEAVIMQTIESYNIERSGMSNASVNETLGQLIFVKTLHPKVKMLLDMSTIKRTKLV